MGPGALRWMLGMGTGEGKVTPVCTWQVPFCTLFVLVLVSACYEARGTVFGRLLINSSGWIHADSVRAS